MSLNIRSYQSELAGAWDEIVKASPFGTFLHTRTFLGYHGDRFVDMSLCIYDEDELVGIFPAAVDPEQSGTVLSHPGITYGGLVHDGRLRGEACVEALRAIATHYRRLPFKRLRYKAVPHVYHRAPSEDDLYALFRLGASRYRCDLSTAVDLANRLPVSKRRRRALKKAQAAGISISHDNQHVAALWEVLAEAFRRRNLGTPVHTLEEIRLLQQLFPENVRFITGHDGDGIVAGVALFITDTVVHTQYIASSERGYEACALDAVMADCIEYAESQRKRYVNFGTSNQDQGRTLVDGIYRFKAEFGGAGIVHEFYEIDLTAI